jgi:lipopolysaccharide export system permease protein
LSRLDRYIVRELFVPFLIGTFVVVMMFQANAYIYIAKEFNVENIPLVARFQWIMYQTLAMTRLTRESELTALRAAGTRILRVVLPVFAFGMCVGVANFYIVDRVVPIATRKANEIERKNAFLGSVALMKSNAFLQIDSYEASLGTVTRDKNDTLLISNVLLIDRSVPDKTTIITAKQGRYDRGIWTFTQTVLYVFRGDDVITAKPASSMTLNLQVSLDQIFNQGQSAFNLEEEPTPELRKEIASAIATRADPRPAQVELYQRYAIPASCAIFALTSPVFSIFFARSGGFVGVLVSFFIVVVYYNAFVISTQILGKMEMVPAWFAAWLPNILFGILGLIAIRKLE